MHIYFLTLQQKIQTGTSNEENHLGAALSGWFHQKGSVIFVI